MRLPRPPREVFPAQEHQHCAGDLFLFDGHNLIDSKSGERKPRMVLEQGNELLPNHSRRAEDSHFNFCRHPSHAFVAVDSCRSSTPQPAENPETMLTGARSSMFRMSSGRLPAAAAKSARRCTRSQPSSAMYKAWS